MKTNPGFRAGVFYCISTFFRRQWPADKVLIDAPLAYMFLTRTDVHFAVNYELTSDPIVTIEITVPDGLIMIMGEPFEMGRTLIVRGVHISTDRIAPTMSASGT